MKTLITLALVLLASPVWADEPDPLFRGLLTGAVIASAADTTTTVIGLRDDRLREGNPLVRPFTSSPTRYLVFSAAVIGTTTYGLTKLHRSHPKLSRWIAGSLLVAETAITARNISLVRGH